MHQEEDAMELQQRRAQENVSPASEWKNFLSSGILKSPPEEVWQTSTNATTSSSPSSFLLGSIDAVSASGTQITKGATSSTTGGTSTATGSGRKQSMLDTWKGRKNSILTSDNQWEEDGHPLSNKMNHNNNNENNNEEDHHILDNKPKNSSSSTSQNNLAEELMEKKKNGEDYDEDEDDELCMISTKFEEELVMNDDDTSHSSQSTAVTPSHLYQSSTLKESSTRSWSWARSSSIGSDSNNNHSNNNLPTNVTEENSDIKLSENLSSNNENGFLSQLRTNGTFSIYHPTTTSSSSNSSVFRTQEDTSTQQQESPQAKGSQQQPPPPLPQQYQPRPHYSSSAPRGGVHTNGSGAFDPEEPETYNQFGGSGMMKGGGNVPQMGFPMQLMHGYPQELPHHPHHPPPPHHPPHHPHHLHHAHHPHAHPYSSMHEGYPPPLHHHPYEQAPGYYSVPSPLGPSPYNNTPYGISSGSFYPSSSNMVVHPHPLGTTGSNGSNGNTSSTSSSTSGDYVLAYNPDVMNRPDSDLDHNNNNSNNKKKNTSTNSNTCSSTTVGNYYAATVSNHYVEEPSLQSSTSPLSSGTTCYYEVEFKRRRRSIFVGSEGSHAIGEYVQVEADRGLDLGHVVRVSMDLTTFRDSVYYTYGDASLGEQQQRRTVLSTPIKRVLRTATQEEINHLNEKYEEEKQVLEICRAKIRQRLLPMSVIDAEFQFDRHKLTFFFEAERRIDFRDLVRDLFGLFKTRIWLQQLNSPSPHATTKAS